MADRFLLAGILLFAGGLTWFYHEMYSVFFTALGILVIVFPDIHGGPDGGTGN